MNKDQILSDVYFNPSNPGSYSSLNALYQAVKDQNISKKEVEKWTEQSEQSVYTLHRKLNRKIDRPRIISTYMNYQWDGDTVNMTYYREANKFAYFAVFIDTFTRFAWTRPLMTLTGKEMVSTMKDVFSHSKPERLRTDQGSEYINRNVKAYLSRNKVLSFTTTHEVKANMVERLNRSIKVRLTRYMHKNHTPHWVAALPKVTSAYNNAIHRSIKMTPTEAIQADRYDVWRNQYKVKEPRKKSKKPPKLKPVFKYKVNDRVRVSGVRSPFERAYTEKWTHEIYTITERENKQQFPMYILKGWDNAPVKGKFYEKELQKVSAGGKIEYFIEKVIKKKRVNKKDGFIVKWVGWPDRYNSWVPKKDVKDRTFAVP